MDGRVGERGVAMLADDGHERPDCNITERIEVMLAGEGQERSGY